MRAYFIAAVVLVSAAPALAGGGFVKGHVRSDGTYVAPHYRSAPDSTKLNNYSTQGNYNPYTGQQGTVDPYRPSQSNPYGSPFNKPRSNTGSSYDPN